MLFWQFHFINFPILLPPPPDINFCPDTISPTFLAIGAHFVSYYRDEPTLSRVYGAKVGGRERYSFVSQELMYIVHVHVVYRIHRYIYI